MAAGRCLCGFRAPGRYGEDEAVAEHRKSQDIAAVGVGLFLVITVLGPFLLGQFVMRQTFLLKPDPRVYEPNARGILDHFWAICLAGVVLVALAVGVFLVVRRPRAFRKTSVAGVGIVLAATLLFLVPITTSHWHKSEQTTMAKLRETAFPFGKRFTNCESWEFHAENGLQQEELWQIHLVVDKGSNVSSCNTVNVYRG